MGLNRLLADSPTPEEVERQTRFTCPWCDGMGMTKGHRRCEACDAVGTLAIAVSRLGVVSNVIVVEPR